VRLSLYPPPSPAELPFVTKAREFSNKELLPFAVEDDEKCFFRRQAFDRAAALGLTAVAIPKKYGGEEAGSGCYYSVLEEIARVSPSMAIVIGVTNLIQGALVSFGTEAQKDRFLPPLTSGKLLGAFSLSEPQAGSDASALRMAAKRVSGGYRLTGNKVWCTSAGVADLYLVMGRTSEDKKGISAFVIPKETPGFRVGKQEKKLGIRSSTLAELVFEDCFIPDDQRLGEEGEGLKVALSQLDAGRISIGVVGLGLARTALEKAWEGIVEGKSPTQEAMSYQLGEYWAHLQAARSLAFHAYAERDAKRRFTSLAAQVKLLGSDLAVQVAQDAIQFLGEKGYRREDGVERLLRDAKALQIVEGTNQIQRLVLARELEEMK
jgi:butyryl-CoA dehydrogenase